MVRFLGRARPCDPCLVLITRENRITRPQRTGLRSGCVCRGAEHPKLLGSLVVSNSPGSCRKQQDIFTMSACCVEKFDSRPQMGASFQNCAIPTQQPHVRFPCRGSHPQSCQRVAARLARSDRPSTEMAFGWPGQPWGCARPPRVGFANSPCSLLDRSRLLKAKFKAAGHRFEVPTALSEL
jgi:hypothetical protein